MRGVNDTLAYFADALCRMRPLDEREQTMLERHTRTGTHRRAWTSDEDQQIIAAPKGTPAAKLAAALKRTRGAVYARKCRLMQMETVDG